MHFETALLDGFNTFIIFIPTLKRGHDFQTHQALQNTEKKILHSLHKSVHSDPRVVGMSSGMSQAK
jgi:hypothetical protein